MENGAGFIAAFIPMRERAISGRICSPGLLSILRNETMENKDITAEIESNMARAFFASAWADAAEECENGPNLSGCEILDVMPETIDPAAMHAARTLRFDIERENGKPITAILAWVADNADGDREPTAEMFGHYCAMQAMGHGVGLYDAFGSTVHDSIRVPYVEFGQHSLQRDYFPE
jgi:hypothetical protein